MCWCVVRAAHCGAFDLKITSHLSIIAVLSCNFLNCFVSIRVSPCLQHQLFYFFLILHFITNLQLRAEFDRIPWMLPFLLFLFSSHSYYFSFLISYNLLYELCFHRLSIIRSTYISCCFFLSLPFLSYLSFLIFLFFFSFLSFLFYLFCSEAVLKALNTLPKKESRAITERLGLGETSSVWRICVTYVSDVSHLMICSDRTSL